MGQVVDAGPLAPVGHGVGMGIGVQLGRPGKQVIVVSGDGGLGIGGMDMETAAKYNIPIITLLWNNSSWGPSFESMPLLKGRTKPFNMVQDIRYDKVFEPMGVYTEHTIRQVFLRSNAPPKTASSLATSASVITLGSNLLGSTKRFVVATDYGCRHREARFSFLAIACNLKPLRVLWSILFDRCGAKSILTPCGTYH